MRCVCLSVVVFMSAGTVSAQPPVADTGKSDAAALASARFHDAKLPAEDRAKDLVSRMTTDEKIAQCMMAAPAIPRLGVPAYYWWNEALHGVARAGTATVFPQAIGLAATWDPSLMHQVATVISTEARAKNAEALRHDQHAIYQGLTLWSPNINIFRDPRWGRGQETYGEDPVLTSRMGVAFVTGIQGDDPVYLKAVATPKHFAVHSGPESSRHSFDAKISESDLRDTYLVAFEACVREGHAASVMAAYNGFNGTPCTGNRTLLTDILRGEWGFNGAVVSDVDSVADIWQGHHAKKNRAEASAMALHAGDDLCSGDTYKGLGQALKSGLASEADLDQAVTRLFTLRFRLGMFDTPEQCAYQRTPFSENDSPAHDALALEAARKSIVLLKNDGVLPIEDGIKTGKIKSVAVIGPLADDEQALLGNYNGTPTHPVTILAGLRTALEPKGVKVTAARGCALVAGFREGVKPLPAGVLFTDAGKGTAGLKGEYFASRTLEGEPKFTRTDAAVDLQWTPDQPAGQIPVNDCSIRWTGVLVAPTSGSYTLGLSADDGCRMWVDGKEILSSWKVGPERLTTAAVTLEAGKAYPIKIEYFQAAGNAAIHLGWSAPGQTSMMDEAVALAAKSDVTILTLGVSPEIEGEEMPVHLEGFTGGDRTTIALPATQQALLEKVTGLGKPVVLVLSGGGAQSFDAGKVNAALVQWYSGQRGGDAVADVLMGVENPGGRLPVTFYASLEDLPAFDDYSMAGRTYRYYAGKPLFAFGHGLGYTTFTYGAPEIGGKKASAKGTISLKVPIRNAGARDGDEVVQVYARRVSPVPQAPAGGHVPSHSLVAFQRVHIPAGATAGVTLEIPAQRLRAWDEGTHAYVVTPGAYELQVGASSADIRGAATVMIGE